MPTRSPPSKKAAEAAKQEALQAALESADKLRRHMRIIVDLGRLASQQVDLNHFLDQTVVQVARAVEIKHVKVLQYRRQTSDLLQVAGIGWKEGVVGNASPPPSDLRQDAPTRQESRSSSLTLATLPSSRSPPC